MQNWEVFQEKISKMGKKEFIERVAIRHRDLLNEIGIKCDCRDLSKCMEVSNCYDCLIKKLNDEYQEPKQEQWIVHRTLRTKNKETYVGHRTSTDYDDVKCGYTMVYQKEYAKRYDKRDAIMVRDELNQNRVGKQYLWVISKVE